MLIQSWINTFQAQRNELKFASGLALASIIIVCFIVIWSAFLSNDPTDSPTVEAFDSSVQTFERPTLANVGEQPQPIKKAVNPSPRPIKHTSAIKTASSLKKKTTSHTTSIEIGQGNIYVQVGAFKQAKLARLLLEKMKKKYKFAKIKQKVSGHAVWVGPVITKTDALVLQKQLQRKDNIQGFITTEK